MKWTVYGNYICGKMWYRVGRQIRETEPLHSGNVEYSGEYTANREEAERRAKELNAKEAEE